MERDRRLTGYLRGQTDNAEAPPGFELNNPWKVSVMTSQHTRDVDDVKRSKSGSSRLFVG